MQLDNLIKHELGKVNYSIQTSKDWIIASILVYGIIFGLIILMIIKG